MTQPLLPQTLERLSIPDAEVYYISSFRLHESPSALLSYFMHVIPWEQKQVWIAGEMRDQPRLTALYADEGKTYTYSGLRLNPLDLESDRYLARVMPRVELCTGHKFNSVLLNLYRDNRDSIGFHSDNEPELGENPVIASVSLGEERTFIFKHKVKKQTVKIRLEHGSLLLMKGTTQKYWLHGMNKQDEKCGPRINLTFRNIL